MRTPNPTADEYYIIPRRVLRGSKSEIVAQLDEAVEGLIALRALIAGREPACPAANDPAPAPRDRSPSAPSNLRPSR